MKPSQNESEVDKMITLIKSRLILSVAQKYLYFSDVDALDFIKGIYFYEKRYAYERNH